MITTLIGLAIVSAQTIVHVDGEGFLRFVRDGRFVYSKEADLTVADGRLVQQDGYEGIPRLTVNGSPTALR